MNKFLAAHATLAGDRQKSAGKSTPPRKPKKYLGDLRPRFSRSRQMKKPGNGRGVTEQVLQVLVSK